MSAGVAGSISAESSDEGRVVRRWILPVATLAARELVRFFRQRTRIVGALGQPFLFWILFGAGLSGSFRSPDWAAGEMSYQEYFFPGVAVMIVMFTAIFSTISIIEDRREGFLQGVLASPAPRSSIVFGKVLGGTALAVLQAIAFLAVGPFLSMFGLSPSLSTGLTVGNAAAVVSFLALIGFSLTALGYLIAWPLDSTQGFHAIMSIFLMPMWLLSGAFFPAAASGWLSWIMWANPLTYGVAGLRQLMMPGTVLTNGQGLPSFAVCVAVMLLFGLFCVTVDVFLTARRSSANTR